MALGLAGCALQPAAEAPPPPAAALLNFSHHYLAPQSSSLAAVRERVRGLDLLRKLPEVGRLDGLLARCCCRTWRGR